MVHRLDVFLRRSNERRVAFRSFQIDRDAPVSYTHTYIHTYKVNKFIHAFIHWSNMMSRCIMCMYEWALLAQLSLIRLVYHPSDNASYVCSDLQVRVSPIRSYKYIHTSIHIYIHTCTLTTSNAVYLWYLVYYSGGSLSLCRALPMRSAALYMYWPFWFLCIWYCNA